MRLSPHFALSEFGCQGEDPPPETHENLRRLCSVLERVRLVTGPLTVTSGWRSQAHNDALPGSSKTSHHLTGEACDLVSPAHSPAELALIVLILRKTYSDVESNVGEVLIEGKHLHLSIRQPFQLLRDDTHA